MDSDKENPRAIEQKKFLLGLIKRFRLKKYLDSDLSWEGNYEGNYALIIDAIRKHEIDSSIEDDFEAMFSIVLGDEILFDDYRHNDVYYGRFLPNRYTAQICKLILFNETIRKKIGLEPFSSNEWEKCRERDIEKITQYSNSLLITHGVEKGSVRWDVEGHNIPLFRTIWEYYRFSDDRHLFETIQSLTKSPDRMTKPLGEGGWYRGSSSLPSFHRFLACCYLIDHIFESSSQWDLMQNISRKSSLAKLIDIGYYLEGEVGMKFTAGLDYNTNLAGEIEWVRTKFRGQAMIASLVLETNEDEIYATCSKLENPVSVKLLYISFFIKKSLYLSSGNYRLSSVFEKSHNEFREVCRGKFIYPLHNLNRSVNSSIPDSAYELKNYLTTELGKMPSEGMGVVQRRMAYKERKNKHHELYSKFGIETSIAREGRGRRIEILFPHQNKVLENIKKEIVYLPYSLNKTITYLEEINSILILPYIVVVTYDHLFQFSRCIYSTGGQGFEDSWKMLYKEIHRIYEIIRKQVGWTANQFGKFPPSIGDIRDELSDIVKKESGEINRVDIIRLQHKMKSSFLTDGDSNWLVFPNLFQEIRNAGYFWGKEELKRLEEIN